MCLVPVGPLFGVTLRSEIAWPRCRCFCSHVLRFSSEAGAGWSELPAAQQQPSNNKPSLIQLHHPRHWPAGTTTSEGSSRARWLGAAAEKQPSPGAERAGGSKLEFAWLAALLRRSNRQNNNTRTRPAQEAAQAIAPAGACPRSCILQSHLLLLFAIDMPVGDETGLDLDHHAPLRKVIAALAHHLVPWLLEEAVIPP
jgi:hypothetical protein